MSLGLAFLLVPIMVVQGQLLSSIYTSSVSDTYLQQNCNPDQLVNSPSDVIESCAAAIQYRCIANQTNCQYSWGLLFSRSVTFKPIGDNCPAWKKGPLTPDCNNAVKAFPYGSVNSQMAQGLQQFLSSPSLALCYSVGGVICNWGSISSTLPSAPTDRTGVANTSSVYLDIYLQNAMAKPFRTFKKRAIVSRLSSSDSTTQSYLDTCNLGTASTSNEFLSGCLAGLTRFCKSSTLQDCHNYYETVYYNSIYSPLVTCLPWQLGPGSSQCAQGLSNVCVQYGPIVNGKVDQGSGVCGFASYSQSKVFKNATYCPQS